MTTMEKAADEVATGPFRLITERVMQAPHDVLFRAWTDAFDRWCAESSSVMTRGTILIVELTPLAIGTHLRLTHGGLPDEKARSRHDATWPGVLADLDRRAMARM